MGDYIHEKLQKSLGKRKSSITKFATSHARLSVLANDPSGGGRMVDANNPNLLKSHKRKSRKGSRAREASSSKQQMMLESSNKKHKSTASLQNS